MSELLQQLLKAHVHASAGEMDKAEQRLHKALQIVNEVAPGRYELYTLMRDIHGYIAEAGLAATQSDSRRAISVLDRAIRELERNTAPNGD